ncbi:ArgP/LysG family DNA-binding transcriptional regulator [Marinomonas sp. TI.3.20]|uniref:ArgP/LysG family DNA-binding transcriptional regulator n=1 Tax=Marinomonas sp. TI.3.20 TaxID=3121296 RepID=UPI00311FF474
MMDYKALNCFVAVLRFQSFERAADHLGLTQSAVSQRIKRLEQACGGPLLIRARPVSATPLGEQLLAHANKVTMLEDGLFELLHEGYSHQPLSIAVNNDVLATWFAQVLSVFSGVDQARLHIKAADQGKTRELLQTGEVVACISQIGTPVSGGESVFLGNMTYELVASPEFIKTQLKNDICIETVVGAPSLIYDEFDDLWRRYQHECLQVKADIRNSHWYPSSHGFVKMIMAGTVCALVPTVQVVEEIRDGRLISLFPKAKLNVPLYWHWYKLKSPVLDRLTGVVLSTARNTLS